MKYEIYQMKIENNYCFRNLPDAVVPNLDWYKKVYEGEILPDVTPERALEGLFYKFNMDRPADFKARSMSVSDLVRFTYPNPNYGHEGKVYQEEKCFVCQNIGWKEVSPITTAEVEGL